MFVPVAAATVSATAQRRISSSLSRRRLVSAAAATATASSNGFNGMQRRQPPPPYCQFRCRRRRRRYHESARVLPVRQWQLLPSPPPRDVSSSSMLMRSWYSSVSTDPSFVTATTAGGRFVWNDYNWCRWSSGSSSNRTIQQDATLNASALSGQPTTSMPRTDTQVTDITLSATTTTTTPTTSSSPPPNSTSTTNSSSQSHNTATAIAQGTYASSTTPTNNNHHHASTTTTPSSSFTSKSAASSSVSSSSRQRRYSIYQMDAALIQTITHIDDLTDLVDQMEGMPTLDAHDVGPLLLPLTRLTSMKQYGHDGAVLTERILLACLARLPVAVADRYPKDDNGRHPSTTLSTDSIVWAALDDDANADFNRNTTARASSSSSTLYLAQSVANTTTSTTTNAASPSPAWPYPTAAMYNRAIIAWGNLQTPAGAERAETLFQLQLHEYTLESDHLRQQQHRRRQRQPTLDDDDDTDTTWSTLLDQPVMEPWAPPPDRRCFKSLIRSWAVSNHEHGAARAHEILTVMEHLSGVHTVLTSTTTTAHSSSSTLNKANRQPNHHHHNHHSAAIRDKKQPSLSSSTSLPYLPSIPAIEMPDLGTYNVVLSVYARLFVLKHPHALKRVQDIVQRLHDLHAATGSDEFILDGYSYMSILQAYSRYIQFCNAPIDPVYSQDLLALVETVHARIQQEKQTGDSATESPRPFDRRKLDGTAAKTNANVDTSLLYPLSMTRLYSVLVEALVKTHPLVETVQLAQDILLALTGQRNHINSPAAAVYNLFGTSGRSHTPIYIPYDVCGHIWPKPESVVHVIQAWERSGLPHAAERVDELLSVVVVDATYARTFALNEALEVWCTSGWPSAPHLVERMLQRALERHSSTQNKPTGQTFGIVMKAWMRSRLKEAPHRAELLLKLMLHLYEGKGDTWFQPREVHIRYVLTAWLQHCKDGNRYDGVFGTNMYPAEHCESLVRTLSGRSWFDRMATGHYAMAIRVWAQQQFPSEQDRRRNPKLGATDSDEPNFVQHASRILDIYAETLPEGERVPAFPCNWVLEACCRQQPTLDRRREAFDVAIQTFRRCRHNARTFTLTVQVLKSQVECLDEKHLSIIEDLCKESCASGLLTQDLVRSVVDVVSAEALQRLFGMSYQMAQMIVAARESSTSTDGFEASVLASRMPSVLLLENLPQEWSQHSYTQRRSKDLLHGR